MKTETITIVGGGSAGWMAAATLIRLFPNKKITLIESKNTPIVGVGESTLGSISDWCRLIRLEDKDFMKECDATYKLSIKFTDFYRKGSGAFHYPFGLPMEHGLDAGKNTWYFKKMVESSTPWSDYAEFLYPGLSLVKENTYGPNENGDLGNFDLKSDSAYHFDAVKFGKVLKDKICIPEGVKHIQDDILDCQKDDDGNIVSLNNKYKADLFIDCTGFKSLLLGKMMGVKFNSYNDLLPNDSALAGRIPYSNKEKELVAYTNCTAIQNGWVWRIPSWERIGTGYVYSSKYVTDEQAKKELLEHIHSTTGFDASDIEFKKINMRVGLHEEIFHKNVIAIGLSAGFIEPLESNGLFTVHQFLTYLSSYLHNEHLNQFDKDGFNFKCKAEFNKFAEFVSLHYYLSKRDDTKYWKDLSSKSIKDLKLLPYSDIDNQLNLKIYNGYHSQTGMHCIGTGLRQCPIDETDIKIKNHINDIKPFYEEHLENQVKARELMMKGWRSAARSKPKLIDVLKEIHEGV